jgi:hypothetical protein
VKRLVPNFDFKLEKFKEDFKQETFSMKVCFCSQNVGDKIYQQTCSLPNGLSTYFRSVHIEAVNVSASIHLAVYNFLQKFFAHMDLFRSFRTRLQLMFNKRLAN